MIVTEDSSLLLFGVLKEAVADQGIDLVSVAAIISSSGSSRSRQVLPLRTYSLGRVSRKPWRMQVLTIVNAALGAAAVLPPSRTPIRTRGPTA